MTGLPVGLALAAAADRRGTGARRVCADWLEERGDPSQAALVRGDDARPADATARARALLVGGPLAPWPGGFRFKLAAGFVTSVHLPTGGATLDAASLGAIAAACPLLMSLDARCPSALVAPDLGLLAGLPRLRELRVGLGTMALEPDGLLPLARSPSLRDINIRNHAGKALATADHRRRRDEALRDYVHTLSGAALADAMEALGVAFRQTPGAGCHFDSGRAAQWLGVLPNVPNLASARLNLPEVPPVVSRLPGLRILELSGLHRFDPASVADLRELRGVTLDTDGLPAEDADALFAWLPTLPHLHSLTVSGERLSPAAARAIAACTGLRRLVLEVDVWNTVPDAICPPGLVEYGTPWPAGDAPDLAQTRAESFGNVTVDVPTRLLAVPPPPATTPGAVPLAAWAEWGDGDPRDRLGPFGPAWLLLERLDPPPAVSLRTAAPVLAAPASALGDPEVWSAPTRPMRGPVRYDTSAEGPLGNPLRRAVWVEPGGAFRLLGEGCGGRAEVFARLFAAVADALRVG